MLVNMLIINRFQTREFAGNYRILPKANRELLPEITRMSYDVRPPGGGDARICDIPPYSNGRKMILLIPLILFAAVLIYNIGQFIRTKDFPLRRDAIAWLSLITAGIIGIIVHIARVLV